MEKCGTCKVSPRAFRIWHLRSKKEKGMQKKPIKSETPHKHVNYGDSNTLRIKIFEIYKYSNPTLITKHVVCLKP